MSFSPSLLAAFVLLSFSSREIYSFTSIITGTREFCHQEGEPVRVDHIDKLRCFSCICKNGLVECKNDFYCPPIDGCHMLVEKTQDGCCHKCKGCTYKGVYHESHTEWSDPQEPCKTMRCEAGAVTVSTVHCHTQCSDPLPPEPGKCCPTCPDCKINGQLATDDRDVTSDDPCLKCRCHGGKLSCAKKACPVLQCGTERQYQPPGECCPKCTGTRTLYHHPKTCTLVSSLYVEGQPFNLDRCTHCTCVNETSICERVTCPILNCSPDFQKKAPGSCCKECVLPEEIRTQCTYEGRTYEDGQSWMLNACSSCRCVQGMPSCAMTRCNVTLPCAPGSKLVKPQGECCERCEESEGVCMVFGDPHYKTFDGKIYSFEGVGRYQLVSDCDSHSFSVRVANAFNTNSKRSTLTKRIAVKAADVRVNLGPDFRARVNGEKVRLPFKLESKLKVDKTKDGVQVALQNGVKVFWTGKGLLEVSVPATFKRKLCGLCGNFNANVQDDLRVRRGGVVNDTRIVDFGTSWCVGQKATCAKQAKQTGRIRPCRVKKHENNPCKYLTSSELFNGCDSKLNYNKYYKACVADMCDCPSGNCYCDSLMAYARECFRLGVDVQGWQKKTYCTTQKMRRKQNHRKVSYTDHQIEQIVKLKSNRSRSNPPPLLIQ